MITIGECETCGAPYDLETVEDATFDEDGELVEPAMYAEVPICGCDQDQ